jgi:predicted aldo/keto reductase-like oxidoreductase
MSKNKGDGLNRRTFLKTGVGVAAGAMTLGGGVTQGQAPDETPATQTGELPTRVLGKTGIELPRLGFGGAAIVTQWRWNVPEYSEEQRVELVRYAFKRGIRYFDTAGNYFECEDLLGRGLEGIRDQVFLNTKVETTDPTKVRQAVETSLGKLRTDHLDGIQIHGTPGIEQMTVERAMLIHSELVKLRDEGMVRFIGLSGHGYFDKLYTLISSGGFDTVLLAAGYFRAGMVKLLSNEMVEYREMCLNKARELGMGTLAMKIIRAGMLGHGASEMLPDFPDERRKQLPAAAVHHVLDDGRFDVLLVGMAVESDVDQNIEAFKNPGLTDDERTLLAEFSNRLYGHEYFKTTS